MVPRPCASPVSGGGGTAHCSDLSTNSDDVCNTSASLLGSLGVADDDTVQILDQDSAGRTQSINGSAETTSGAIGGNLRTERIGCERHMLSSSVGVSARVAVKHDGGATTSQSVPTPEGLAVAGEYLQREPLSIEVTLAGGAPLVVDSGDVRVFSYTSHDNTLNANCSQELFERGSNVPSTGNGEDHTPCANGQDHPPCANGQYYPPCANGWDHTPCGNGQDHSVTTCYIPEGQTGSDALSVVLVSSDHTTTTPCCLSSHVPNDTTLLLDIQTPMLPAELPVSSVSPSAMFLDSSSTLDLPQVNPSTLDHPQVSPSTLDLPQVNPSTLDLPQVSPSTLDLPQVNPSTLDLPQVNPSTLDLPQVSPSTLDLSQVNPSTLDIPQVSPSTLDLPQVNPSTLDLPQVSPSTLDLSQVNPSTLDLSQVSPSTLDLPQVSNSKMCEAVNGTVGVMEVVGSAVELSAVSAQWEGPGRSCIQVDEPGGATDMSHILCDPVVSSQDLPILKGEAGTCRLETDSQSALISGSNVLIQATAESGKKQFYTLSAGCPQPNELSHERPGNHGMQNGNASDCTCQHGVVIERALNEDVGKNKLYELPISTENQLSAYQMLTLPLTGRVRESTWPVNAECGRLMPSAKHVHQGGKKSTFVYPTGSKPSPETRGTTSAVGRSTRPREGMIHSVPEHPAPKRMCKGPTTAPLEECQSNHPTAQALQFPAQPRAPPAQPPPTCALSAQVIPNPAPSVAAQCVVLSCGGGSGHMDTSDHAPKAYLPHVSAEVSSRQLALVDESLPPLAKKKRHLIVSHGREGDQEQEASVSQGPSAQLTDGQQTGGQGPSAQLTGGQQTVGQGPSAQLTGGQQTGGQGPSAQLTGGQQTGGQGPSAQLTDGQQTGGQGPSAQLTGGQQTGGQGPSAQLTDGQQTGGQGPSAQLTDGQQTGGQGPSAQLTDGQQTGGQGPSAQLTGGQQTGGQGPSAQLTGGQQTGGQGPSAQLTDGPSAQLTGCDGPTATLQQPCPRRQRFPGMRRKQKHLHVSLLVPTTLPLTSLNVSLPITNPCDVDELPQHGDEAGVEICSRLGKDPMLKSAGDGLSESCMQAHVSLGRGEEVTLSCSTALSTKDQDTIEAIDKPCTSFCTASGRTITISAHALSRAKELVGEDMAVNVVNSADLCSELIPTERRPAHFNQPLPVERSPAHSNQPLPTKRSPAHSNQSLPNEVALISNSSPRGTHCDATSSPRGTHCDATSSPRGTHCDATSSPRGTHCDATSSPRGTHCDATSSPRGTHCDATSSPRGTHCDATFSPRGTHCDATSSPRGTRCGAAGACLNDNKICVKAPPGENPSNLDAPEGHPDSEVHSVTSYLGHLCGARPTVTNEAPPTTPSLRLPSQHSLRQIPAASKKRTKVFKPPRSAASVSKDEERASIERILGRFRASGTAPSSGGSGGRRDHVTAARGSESGRGHRTMIASAGVHVPGESFSPATSTLGVDGASCSPPTLSSLAAPPMLSALAAPPCLTVGFVTASGKGLVTSVAALEKAKALEASVESSMGGENAGLPRGTSMECWGTGDPAVTREFPTGAFGNVATSGRDHHTAKEEDRTGKQHISLCISPVRSMSLTAIETASTPKVQTVGFQTASGKPLGVSSNALKKAQSLMDDVSLPEKTSSISPGSVPKVQAIGFQTASGKPLGVSSNALKKAQSLMDDLSLPEKTSSISPGSVPKVQAIGFQTASGKPLGVSSNALKKAQSLMDDLSLPEKTSSISPGSVPKVQSIGFQTASGKPLGASSEALAKNLSLIDSVSEKIALSAGSISKGRTTDSQEMHEHNVPVYGDPLDTAAPCMELALASNGAHNDYPPHRRPVQLGQTCNKMETPPPASVPQVQRDIESERDAICVLAAVEFTSCDDNNRNIPVSETGSVCRASSILSIGIAPVGSSKLSLDAISSDGHLELFEESAMELDMDDEDLHLSTQDLHLSTQDLHLSTQDLHLNTQDLHLNTQDLHLNTQDLHLSTQDLHLNTQAMSHLQDFSDDEENGNPALKGMSSPSHSAPPQIVSSPSHSTPPQVVSSPAHSTPPPIISSHSHSALSQIVSSPSHSVPPCNVSSPSHSVLPQVGLSSSHRVSPQVRLSPSHCVSLSSTHSTLPRHSPASALQDGYDEIPHCGPTGTPVGSPTNVSDVVKSVPEDCTRNDSYNVGSKQLDLSESLLDEMFDGFEEVSEGGGVQPTPPTTTPRHPCDVGVVPPPHEGTLNVRYHDAECHHVVTPLNSDPEGVDWPGAEGFSMSTSMIEGIVSSCEGDMNQGDGQGVESHLMEQRDENERDRPLELEGNDSLGDGTVGTGHQTRGMVEVEGLGGRAFTEEEQLSCGEPHVNIVEEEVVHQEPYACSVREDTHIVEKPLDGKELLLGSQELMGREWTVREDLGSVPKPSFPTFMTAGGKIVEVQQSSLDAVRENPGSTPKPSFMTAGGKMVEVQQSSLDAVRENLGSAPKPSFMTAGGKMVEVQQSSLDAVRENPGSTPKPSFMTAGGKMVEVQQSSLDAVRENPGSTPKPSFMTAGGKMVEVQQSSLDAVRGNLGSTPKPSFMTAGGKMVEVQQSSLDAVRENLGSAPKPSFMTAGGKMVEVQQSSLDAVRENLGSVPKPSFMTAGGKMVEVQQSSLDAVRENLGSAPKLSFMTAGGKLVEVQQSSLDAVRENLGSVPKPSFMTAGGKMVEVQQSSLDAVRENLGSAPKPSFMTAGGKMVEVQQSSLDAVRENLGSAPKPSFMTAGGKMVEVQQSSLDAVRDNLHVPGCQLDDNIGKSDDCLTSVCVNPSRTTAAISGDTPLLDQNHLLSTGINNVSSNHFPTSGAEPSELFKSFVVLDIARGEEASVSEKALSCASERLGTCGTIHAG